MQSRTHTLSLAGRTALVTGCASGIGPAIASAFARRGMRAWMVDPMTPSPDTDARAAPPTAAEVRTRGVDLTREDSVADLAGTVGALDVLVLATTLHSTGRIAETPSDALDAVYRANVRANYRIAQTFLPSLIRRAGDIVFINAASALEARPAESAVSASHYALRALADSLRAEVDAHGVRVSSLYAGPTATLQLEALYASRGETYRPEHLLQPTDVAAAVLNMITLPRTAAITEVSLRPMRQS